MIPGETVSRRSLEAACRASKAMPGFFKMAGFSLMIRSMSSGVFRAAPETRVRMTASIFLNTVFCSSSGRFSFFPETFVPAFSIEMPKPLRIWETALRTSRGSSSPPASFSRRMRRAIVFKSPPVSSRSRMNCSCIRTKIRDFFPPLWTPWT